MLSKAPTGRIVTTGPKNKPKKPSPEVKPANTSNRISTRLEAKVVHPLGQDAHRTAFSALYSKGGVPCRLSHGSVRHKITWSTSPVQLDYNPILITFFEGLKETRHPYVFVVQQGIIELLDAPGARDKVKPLVPALILPLRSALTSQNKETYKTALNLVRKLAILVGPCLVPHLGLILPPIASRVLSPDIQIKELSYEVLGVCEFECGLDALKAIRARVPTYSSLYSTK